MFPSGQPNEVAFQIERRQHMPVEGDVAECSALIAIVSITVSPNASQLLAQVLISICRAQTARRRKAMLDGRRQPTDR